MSKYVYVVQLSVPEEHIDLFNDLYDTDHIPAILTVPGVNACRRYQLEWVDGESMPQFLAIYEVDDPNIPKGDAWKTAAGTGRWPSEVRPILTERFHGMYRMLGDTFTGGAS